MKQRIENKIISHLIIDGKKKTSEKILLKSFKNLQKYSKKQSKELIKLAIVFSSPVFTLRKLTNKKKRKKKQQKTQKIPSFITNKKARTSLAIKFIITSTTTKNLKNFYTKFNQEILLNAQSKESTIQIKNEIQKQIMQNKRYFKNYRW
jgi:ribosomal protein S7